MVRAARQLFREGKYDVVLTFLWLPTLIVALASRGLARRPRLVWSVQTDLKQDLALHWDGYLRRILIRAFLGNAVAHYIVTCKPIKHATQDLLRVSEDRFSVIPNGIDLARIRGMAEANAATVPKRVQPRVVIVGRLHSAKGVDVLLRALSVIAAEGTGFECYIVGDGAERERLTRLSSELGLGRCVRFIGYASNPYSLICTADVFVSASRWETFGIAIVEGMALGLAVVATATDGAQDIITDGLNGLLVPVGDPEALAHGISRLLRDPLLRQTLGSEARSKAEQFDARLIASRYAVVLDGLVGS